MEQPTTETEKPQEHFVLPEQGKLMFFRGQVVNLNRITRIHMDVQAQVLRFHDGSSSFTLNVLTHPKIRKFLADGSANEERLLDFILRHVIRFWLAKDPGFFDLWQTLDLVEKKDANDGRQGHVSGNEGGTEAGASGA